LFGPRAPWSVSLFTNLSLLRFKQPLIVFLVALPLIHDSLAILLTSTIRDVRPAWREVAIATRRCLALALLPLQLLPLQVFDDWESALNGWDASGGEFGEECRSQGLVFLLILSQSCFVFFPRLDLYGGAALCTWNCKIPASGETAANLL